MQSLFFILKWIQQNKLVYLLTVAFITCVLNSIISFIFTPKQKPHYTEDSQSSPSQPVNRKKKWIKRPTIVFFLTTMIPLAIALYYPPDIDDSVGIVSDGYIKLMFYNGKFAYHTHVGQNVYIIEDDIISPRDRAFFDDPVAPLTYITIVDTSGQIVYDGKSEHMESCLVPMEYGEYKIIISCDNYQKYEVDISLTPYNKKSDIWMLPVYLIPDSHIATDIQIQVVDSTGTPYSDFKISIGYSGYGLYTFTNEDGLVDEFYILAEGEYLLSIEEIGVAGRFVINKLTEDNSTIVVTLD